MEEAKIIANLLKVIANENRLYIVCKLLEESMTVGQLQEVLGNVSQAAVSQHLAVLKANQLVESSKEGMHVRYSIADHRLRAVLEVLKSNYCQK